MKFIPCGIALKACFLFFFIAQQSVAAEEKHIRFSCWIPSDLPAFSALETLYRDAFSAIGYEFTMIHKPALRSLAEANSGLTDGECARVANYKLSAPTSPLKRVDVMIAKTDLAAWSYDKTIKVNGPASLVDTDFNVAYGKGNVAMDLLLSRFPIKKLQSVTSIDLGIRMLARKRIDILIAPRAIFNQEILRNPTDTELYFAGTLMVMEGYPYMHERHQELIPAFTESLGRLTPDGGLPLP